MKWKLFGGHIEWQNNFFQQKVSEYKKTRRKKYTKLKNWSKLQNWKIGQNCKIEKLDENGAHDKWHN